jgi:hypothetical protein
MKLEIIRSYLPLRTLQNPKSRPKLAASKEKKQ